MNGNEIKTINKIHELLIEIFPNTKMSVVHGQMKPEKIEKIDFLPLFEK